LTPNLQAMADYLDPVDVVVDVGGGAGRLSLPLALRCKQVINVDPSNTMGAAFMANAAQAGVSNVRFIAADWELATPPEGDVALVNNVTYMTRDIVPFLEKLEKAGRKRVVITVNAPPPPSRQRVLYQMLHGEVEEAVPGHVELVNVLWEMGLLPDVKMLAGVGAAVAPASPTKDEAVAAAIAGFSSDQWTFWPMGAELEERLRRILEDRFEELFSSGPEGFTPRWPLGGREVLITWRPGLDRQ
jgi:SAM-dependent methyltransferase